MESCRFLPAMNATVLGLLLSCRLQDEGVASSWNDFFGVIRDNNSLPATMRELFVSTLLRRCLLAELALTCT